MPESNEILKEEEKRNKRDKEYLNNRDYGYRQISMFQQLLGLNRNYLQRNINDQKELLTLYKHVLKNDNGKIIEHSSDGSDTSSNKAKIINSLENSIDTMGYKHLTENN